VLFVVQVCGAKVGSWAFVALQTMWLLSWVLLNTLLPAVNTDIGASVNPTAEVEISWWSLLIKGKAWDPYDQRFFCVYCTTHVFIVFFVLSSYPFVFLNLLLSALSALTAPVCDFSGFCFVYSRFIFSGRTVLRRSL
jgi:hypothetical protein